MAFLHLLVLLLLLFVSPTHCRKRPRIIRGRSTSTNAFPSAVLIRIWYHKHRVTVCTGSLLDKRHVLTAAHCIKVFDQRDKDTPIEAYLGATYVVDGDDSKSKTDYQLIPVHSKDIKLHRKYDRNTNLNQYDLMIMKLSAPAVFGRNVQPVNMVHGNLSMSEQVHDTCFAVGYGLVEVDKDATQIQIGQMWAMYSDEPTFFAFPSGPKMSSGCAGDSGAPLFCPSQLRRSRLLAAGILSGGTGICGNTEDEVQFINLAFYAEWIRSMIS